MAQEYADKRWPCTKPCDSYGDCEKCGERTIFDTGIRFGVRIGRQSAIEDLRGASAIEFFYGKKSANIYFVLGDAADWLEGLK